MPDPQPGPGDVVVAVHATALNRLDIVQRNGWFTLPGFSLPHISGMDLAGQIVALGSAVEHWQIGDRVVADPSLNDVRADSSLANQGDRYGELGVIGATQPGGYGALCCVPADHVHRVPDDMDFITAAVFATAWMTADHALFETGQLRQGETLLLHGATSSLSMAAIQLAKAAGATVLATAGTPSKCAKALQLGAAAAANNRSEDIAEWVMAHTQGRGVDMVFDHVGPALWQASLSSLAPRGRLVSSGNTTGDATNIPSLGQMFQRGLRIVGADAYRSARFAEVWARYCQGIKSGDFGGHIERTFAIDEGAKAHTRLESGEALGKLVLCHPAAR